MEYRSRFPRKGVLLKVTEADYTRLRDLAEAHGKSLSSWCLDILLSSARHVSGTPSEQAILSELIALRTIVANLVYAFTTEGTVTREQMLAFIERADKTKLKRAAEFLSQVHRDGATLSNDEPHAPDREG